MKVSPQTTVPATYYCSGQALLFVCLVDPSPSPAWWFGTPWTAGSKLRGLSAGTGKLCIFGHLGLVFIWSCFVSCLLLLLYYVICAPVLTEGTKLRASNVLNKWYRRTVPCCLYTYAPSNLLLAPSTVPPVPLFHLIPLFPWFLCSPCSTVPPIPLLTVFPLLPFFLCSPVPLLPCCPCYPVASIALYPCFPYSPCSSVPLVPLFLLFHLFPSFPCSCSSCSLSTVPLSPCSPCFSVFPFSPLK